MLIGFAAGIVGALTVFTLLMSIGQYHKYRTTRFTSGRHQDAEAGALAMSIYSTVLGLAFIAVLIFI